MGSLAIPFRIPSGSITNTLRIFGFLVFFFCVLGIFFVFFDLFGLFVFCLLLGLFCMCFFLFFLLALNYHSMPIQFCMLSICKADMAVVITAEGPRR